MLLKIMDLWKKINKEELTLPVLLKIKKTGNKLRITMEIQMDTLPSLKQEK